MAQAREEIEATEIEPGNEVFFPNSRLPQKIDSVVQGAGGTTLISGDAQWLIGAGIKVKRLVQTSDEEG